MNNAIIFLFFIILFLSLMLVIKIKSNFDLNNNKLIIIIYVYNLKILTISVSIIGLYYKINNSKKLKKLQLILKPEDKYFLNQIKSSILDKLYYDDIILESKIGLGQASSSAITIGVLNQLSIILSNYLYGINRDIRLFFNHQPDFEKSNVSVDLELKVYFTIFDMVYAIIMSFYKRGKYVKTNKQKG